MIIQYDSHKGDYFDISLLGRCYARLSVIDGAKKDYYLSEAEHFIEEYCNHPVHVSLVKELLKRADVTVVDYLIKE